MTRDEQPPFDPEVAEARKRLRVLVTLEGTNFNWTLEEVDAVQAQIDEAVSKVIADDAKLKRIHYEEGSPLEMSVEHWGVRALVGSFRDSIGDAPNYMEVCVWDDKTDPRQEYVVRIQRRHGKTPAELRREAEENLVALQEACIPCRACGSDPRVSSLKTNNTLRDPTTGHKRRDPSDTRDPTTAPMWEIGSFWRSVEQDDKTGITEIESRLISCLEEQHRQLQFYERGSARWGEALCTAQGAYRALQALYNHPWKGEHPWENEGASYPGWCLHLDWAARVF